MNKTLSDLENYQTPTWLKQKISRRSLLKSAAGAASIASMPSIAFDFSNSLKEEFTQQMTQLKWQTIDAVFEHLFPASDIGPSATDIQATFYLYQLVHAQPTEQDEIDFVYKGVGWLNGYTQNKQQKSFVELDFDTKEQMLRGISQSSAGQNWLNMMILNLYEAMLSPPAYGGNPDGIGWKWINHQAGFPLPKAGKRYYELPTRSSALSNSELIIDSKDLLARHPTNTVKRTKKA